MIKPIAQPGDREIVERAFTLADAVCSAIWGGEVAWETCTDAQFKSLVAAVRKLEEANNE